MYLFILKNKCMYVYLISLGSIYVRFYFSISCMISVHGLSHGSSSAFCLHAVQTFCFSIFLWFGSSWQWSNRPPKTINSCRSGWTCFLYASPQFRYRGFLFQSVLESVIFYTRLAPICPKKCPYHVVERLWLIVR